MRVELRPTVASDLRHVIDVPLPHRIRAITAYVRKGKRERILGVGGIGYRPNGAVVGFAVIKDELRKYPTALHRAGLAGMAMVRDAGVRVVVAEAQEDNPAAEPWLERLGFRKCDDGGLTVFVWESGANVE